MSKHFTFTGARQWFYPMSENRTGFAIQSDTFFNFNDAVMIANAANFAAAPMWNHSELHITRVRVLYQANAAGTMLNLYVYTGSFFNYAIGIPVGKLYSMTAATENVLDSGEIDVSIEPTGKGNSSSAYAFILCNIETVDAADDIAINFQGWYRDRPPFTEPQPEQVQLVGVQGPLSRLIKR